MKFATPETVAARIAEARRKHFPSQAAFAAKLVVSQPTVCHWETGLSLPPPARWNEIAKHLKTTVEDLFFAAGRKRKAS